jgi:hypothetical protein
MFSTVRLNFQVPGLDRKALAAAYSEGIAMARYADENGFDVVSFEEHHGTDLAWSPSPLITAGAVLGGTKNIRVVIQALLVPLHDPLRIAEDIAVLDHIGGGRLMLVSGLGYRPDEYAMFDMDWKGRGALVDEDLEAILNAWTGEPFTYRGRTVRVTPPPASPPQQILFVGGSGKPGARRAARLGLGFIPSAAVPELEPYYNEKCAEYGTTPFMMAPPEHTVLTMLSDDPDRAWAGEVGKGLFVEASTYASWQTPDIKSAVHSHAKTVEELREENIYEIITPEEAITLGRQRGSMILHPMCGGISPELGWETMRTYVDKVLPALKGS